MTGRSTAASRLHQARGNPRLGLLLALCTVVLWGFLSIALKLLLEGMDAFTITWYRLAASALVLGLYQARQGRLPAVRRLGRNGWALLAVALLGLVGNYVLFLVSLEYVPPQRTRYSGRSAAARWVISSASA